MPIEIIVGLPHLSEGPILQRARALHLPVLISANCLSRWKRHDGWREWAGWRLGTLANAHGLASLDLDSGGYTAMVRYGSIPWGVDDYMSLAASYPFRRFASLDYCCEEAVAPDREEVLDRVARTIRTNRDCRMRAADLGILDRLMPVIQGRFPTDYERCIDGLSHALPPGTVIGIGSVCRRPTFGPEGLIAIFEHLDRVLPAGVLIHGFGVKGDALPYLRAFDDRLTSVDSQAYGTMARFDAIHRRQQDRSAGCRPYAALDRPPDDATIGAGARSTGRAAAAGPRIRSGRSVGARYRSGARRSASSHRER